MKTQLNAITLAVKDVARLKRFYTGIFAWEIMDENPYIVMLRLDHIILTLFEEEQHAKYLGVRPGEHRHPKFYLTINTSSSQETDQLFAELKAKNVPVIKEPRPLFWGGYGGFIADPENNYWEICYNPFS